MISIRNIFQLLNCRINRATARCYSVCWENLTIDSLPAPPAELWSGFTHVASIYANLLEFTKEMFYIRKEFNSLRVGLHGRRLIVLEHQNGRRVVMVRNSQDGLLPRKQSLRIIFFLLSVENSTLGTIIRFKTIGISFCWNHHLGTFHSSFTPHPSRMRDFLLW